MTDSAGFTTEQRDTQRAWREHDEADLRRCSNCGLQYEPEERFDGECPVCIGGEEDATLRLVNGAGDEIGTITVSEMLERRARTTTPNTIAAAFDRDTRRSR